MRTRAIDRRVVGLVALLAVIVLLVATMVGSPSDQAQAQTASVDFYLKIEGIDGESLNDRHANEIEVDSWSWGESNSTRPLGGASGAGKVSMNDFNFTMKVSKASPQLFLASAQGKIIPSATLEAVRASAGSGQTYLKWELKNVVISSYQTGVDQATGLPTDRIKMKFTQIIVTYTTQNADGSAGEVVRAGWDLAKAKSI